MPSHPDEVKPNYFDWWSIPFFEWHVHVDYNTNIWTVLRYGKLVLKDTFDA